MVDVGGRQAETANGGDLREGGEQRGRVGAARYGEEEMLARTRGSRGVEGRLQAAKELWGLQHVERS